MKLKALPYFIQSVEIRIRLPFLLVTRLESNYFAHSSVQNVVEFVQKFVAMFYADICPDGSVNISLPLLLFNYPVFVSAGDMTSFEDRLSDMVRNYGNLYGYSHNTYKDCQNG